MCHHHLIRVLVPTGIVVLSNTDSLPPQVREKHRTKLRQHHQQFHRVWGQLLKTGYQNSQLAHQAERFACLYTSHVANLLYYSPDKSYRCAWEWGGGCVLTYIMLHYTRISRGCPGRAWT